MESEAQGNSRWCDWYSELLPGSDSRSHTNFRNPSGYSSSKDEEKLLKRLLGTASSVFTLQIMETEAACFGTPTLHSRSASVEFSVLSYEGRRCRANFKENSENCSEN